MKKCAACGKEVGGDTEEIWVMCDREEADTYWCTECFVETPCGEGEHGEGCATVVC